MSECSWSVIAQYLPQSFHPPLRHRLVWFFFSLATDILSLDIECDYTVLSRSQEVTTNNNETCCELSQENAKHPAVTNDARIPKFPGKCS